MAAAKKAGRVKARKAASNRRTSVPEREFDFVLLGATGYTGGLVAEYLAERAPEGARWAIAGRDEVKLAQVRSHISRVHPVAESVSLLRADVHDAVAMQRLARRTRVLATTVGPYVLHGEAVVAACAHAGTHYLDLTGEPEFVDRSWLRYQRAAEDSGARLVHCCGFDSIPHDLGALFTVQQLPEEAAKRVEAFVRWGGGWSAGTYHSALLAFSRLRKAAATHRERRRRERVASARSIGAVHRPPHFETRLKRWVMPLPTVDPQIVMRSAGSLPAYGPEFRYGHYLEAGSLAQLLALGGGAGALLALTQIPPARRWLMRRKRSGEGPSDAQRRDGHFRVRFFGEGGGRRVVVDVIGGDPGYGETSRMLGEATLCMAFDRLPKRAGQLTPAVAMGDALRRRLQAAGIEFRVVERA